MIWAESAGVSVESPGFWILLAPILATLAAALAGVAGSIAAYINAKAANIRAESVAMNLTRDREVTRQNSDKIEHIARQTDGHLTDAVDLNKSLLAELTMVKESLAKLQGREIERKDSTAAADIKSAPP